MFTVTQLAYTFRAKSARSTKPEPKRHSQPLQAMAIRDATVYVRKSPELPEAATAVFLDVEGIPDQGFDYLVGILPANHAGPHYEHFWATSPRDEAEIWQAFADRIVEIDPQVIYHYGRYDSDFIRRAGDRYGYPAEFGAARFETALFDVPPATDHRGDRPIRAQTAAPAEVRSRKRPLLCVGGRTGLRIEGGTTISEASGKISRPPLHVLVARRGAVEQQHRRERGENDRTESADLRSVVLGEWPSRVPGVHEHSPDSAAARREFPALPLVGGNRRRSVLGAFTEREESAQVGDVGEPEEHRLRAVRHSETTSYIQAGRVLPPPTRRIATHKEPDADALAATWLAERFLFSGKACRVEFVAREYRVPAKCPFDAVLDVGRLHDT